MNLETAAVLTCVLNSWGNQSSPISAQQVKQAREQTKGHNAFWKPDELLKLYPMQKKQ